MYKPEETMEVVKDSIKQVEDSIELVEDSMNKIEDSIEIIEDSMEKVKDTIEVGEELIKVEDSMERIEKPWKRELVRGMLKIYLSKLEPCSFVNNVCCCNFMLW